MKKIVGLLGMLAMLLFAVQAQAVQLGLYSEGALVPSVYHDGANIDTVVGIICQIRCTDQVQHHPVEHKKPIHWTFYDVDSFHVTDGTLYCTDDDLVGFSWKASSGRGLENREGYLVFHSQDANTTISANAFLVDQNKKDAIFIPVVPLRHDDFNTDRDATDKDEIVQLQNGIHRGTNFDVRYWIDPTYQAATTIVVWLTDPYVDSKGKPIKMIFVARNDEERDKSVTITFPHELNKICPGTLEGMPADFIDGFIQMTMPASIDGFAYSYISSTLFGAQQTLLAAECGPIGGNAAPPRNNSSCGCVQP